MQVGTRRRLVSQSNKLASLTQAEWKYVKRSTRRSEDRGEQGSTIGGGGEEFVEGFCDTIYKKASPRRVSEHFLAEHGFSFVTNWEPSKLTSNQLFPCHVDPTWRSKYTNLLMPFYAMIQWGRLRAA